MGKVLLNTGKLATTPYYFEKTGQNLYSVEELCFVLGENTFLLDAEIFSVELADWLDKECGLPDLTRELYRFIHQKGTLSAYVTTILEYVGYYSEERIKEIEDDLKNSIHLNVYEKRKSRIDYLLKNHKFSQALWEYDKILRDIPEQSDSFKAAILHNKGVALAGLFLFEQAAGFFKQAYEITGNIDEQKSYLAAMRMHYDDKDYISFIAERPESYEISLELEREVDDILTVWENSEEYLHMMQLRKLKQQGQSSLYYDEMESASWRLKDQYRKDIAE